MAGNVCHRHFVECPFDDEVTDNCLDCKAAKKTARDYTQLHRTIRPDAPYGQHIGIVCRVCGTKGTTKNISPLGCRSIFVFCEHGAADMEVAS